MILSPQRLPSDWPWADIGITFKPLISKAVTEEPARVIDQEKVAFEWETL
jgi:hypothetical protein